MLTVLIFSFLAQAAIREHDLHPGPRSFCRRAEMNSCIEGHRAAQQAELAAIAAIEGKMRIVATDRDAIQRELLAIESEERKAIVTAEMAMREVREVEILSSREPVFTGGPRAEEIFFLKGELSSWQERHAPERRDRLNTLAESSKKKSARLAPLRQNLAMEIGALDALNASLMGERHQRGQQVNVHADMCERGCKMQFCRDE